ncbi:hypothetical protein JTE90_000951 [Oedothorax gibbosus]|uniref:Uncharacterized protein n=1 Tax=Oedothorax gibbosus TaxID=931172 RepID=A0AAV6TKT8_9ARAC|nr:hypothetical protein JTE90_000951 [Oedothorax gibbosus]
MDISDLLKDWEFGELAQQFIENGINMEVLKICRFEDISSGNYFEETADESVTDKLDWLSKSGASYEKAYLYWKETVRS